MTQYIHDYSNVQEFTNKEIKIAKQEIIKLSQDECFEEEKVILVSNRFLPKSSRMYV